MNAYVCIYVHYYVCVYACPLSIVYVFFCCCCVWPDYPYDKIIANSLYMQVLDYDRFSKDDPIGELCIPLSEFDLVTGQTLWKNLQPSEGATVSETKLPRLFHLQMRTFLEP